MMNSPAELLLICSRTSLQEFELNRLNQAANLRKHLHSIEEDLRHAEAEALLARWLMENRDEIVASSRVQPLQQVFNFLPPVGALRRRRLKAIRA